MIVTVFSCPSSTPTLGWSVDQWPFRIWTKIMTFEIWDPSDIWSEWCKDKKTKKNQNMNDDWWWLMLFWCERCWWWEYFKGEAPCSCNQRILSAAAAADLHNINNLHPLFKTKLKEYLSELFIYISWIGLNVWEYKQTKSKKINIQSLHQILWRYPVDRTTQKFECFPFHALIFWVYPRTHWIENLMNFFLFLHLATAFRYIGLWCSGLLCLMIRKLNPEFPSYTRTQLASM